MNTIYNKLLIENEINTLIKEFNLWLKKEYEKKDENKKEICHILIKENFNYISIEYDTNTIKIICEKKSLNKEDESLFTQYKELITNMRNIFVDFSKQNELTLHICKEKEYEMKYSILNRN